MEPFPTLHEKQRKEKKRVQERERRKGERKKKGRGKRKNTFLVTSLFKVLNIHFH